MKKTISVRDVPQSLWWKFVGHAKGKGMKVSELLIKLIKKELGEK